MLQGWTIFGNLFKSKEEEIFDGIEQKNQKYFPKNSEELTILLLFKKIKAEEIDTSGIEGSLRVFETFKFKNTTIRLQENTIYGSIEDWDVSNIESFKRCFDGIIFENPNQDLSKWNTSKGIDFSYMFKESNFDGNVSKFDVSNGRTFISMFDDSDFTGKNGGISDWDVSSGEEFIYMFYCCQLDDSVKLNKWNFSNGRLFSYMFQDSKYNFDLNEKYFQTVGLEMKGMFQSCKSKNIIDLSKWKGEGNEYENIVSGLRGDKFKLNEEFEGNPY